LTALRAALYDELHDVHIVFLGDSITWGNSVSNSAPSDPRGHTLDDVRNHVLPDTTITPNRPIPPSWFNLLHQYFGRRFSVGVLTSPAPGVALYTAQHIIDVANDPNVSVVNSSTGVAAGKVISTITDSLMQQCCDVSNGNALKFSVTSNNFTICYATLNNHPDDCFEVFVDGVLQGVVSTYHASITYGLTAEYAVQWAKHDVLVVCHGATTRFEGIKRTRTIRLKNQGLIGTNTAEWLPTRRILPSSITADDEFVFVQLGTNDRVKGPPADPAWTKRNLTVIARYLLNAGKKVTLMTANFATKDYPTGSYRYGQADIARVTVHVANENKCSLIDNYEATLRQYLDGTLSLADGLHPADASHMAMFKNIASRIDSAA